MYIHPSLLAVLASMRLNKPTNQQPTVLAYHSRASPRARVFCRFTNHSRNQSYLPQFMIPLILHRSPSLSSTPTLSGAMGPPALIPSAMSPVSSGSSSYDSAFDGIGVIARFLLPISIAPVASGVLSFEVTLTPRCARHHQSSPSSTIHNISTHISLPRCLHPPQTTPPHQRKERSKLTPSNNPPLTVNNSCPGQ
jgi:hypothetical protein